MNPIGGTELQYKLLEKYIDSKLLDNFQLTTSVPEKIPLAKDKINITTKSMIGMYLILIGVMKNLEWYTKYQQKNAR